MQRRQGVRTGGDGLRLVRRDMPTGGRLPRDDAAQVPIERQHVHRHQPAASALDDDVSTVRQEVHLQRLRAGLEAERLLQMRVQLHEPAPDDHRARRKMKLAPARVDHEEG